jgi:hypothetical protein
MGDICHVRAAKGKYRVLFRSPFHGDTDDQMYRIVAEANSLDEAMKV